MNPLERLQTDIETYLLSCVSDPAAGDAPIECAAIARVRPRTAEEAAGIQTRLQRILAGLEGRNGRKGMSIIIGMPEIGRVEPNVRALRGAVTVTIRVTEYLMVNMGADGCGQGAEAFALLVAELLNHQAFAHWSPLRLASVRPDPEAVMDKMVVYDVRMETDLRGTVRSKVPPPAIEITEGGLMTLAVATAGAEIYWTLDGSYPGPGGSTAARYSEPVQLPAGTHALRVAAWLPGSAGSVPVEQAVTVEE